MVGQNKLNVIIPSYKRADNLVGKDYFLSAKYCVSESQKKEYIDAVGIDRVIVLPDEQGEHIGKKRNWILQNVARPLIMIDDDVKYLAMWDDREKNYLRKTVDKELIDELLESFVNLAIEFDVKMFGLAQNTDDRTFKEHTPFNLTNIILGPFQGHLEHDLMFDEGVGSKDDYDMALQQLRKYKKVLRLNKFAYDCGHGNNKGGMVSSRTVEKEIEYCQAIMKKWGKKVIRYNLPPEQMTDLLNAHHVNVPISGV